MKNITLHALHEFEAGHREGSAQCMTADLAALYLYSLCSGNSIDFQSPKKLRKSDNTT